MLFSVIITISVFIFPVNAEESTNDIEIGTESVYGLVYDGFVPNLPVPDETESHTTLSSYDPRITNMVTPVKNQANNGVCWAFASVALLETSVLKNTGVKYSYSEQALRFATSNKIEDVMGSSSDIGLYTRSPFKGGSIIIGMSYLTRRNSPISDYISWNSPNLERDVPYTENDSLLDDAYWPSNMDTSYGNAYASDTIYIDFEYVKDYILEYGGVYFTFCSYDSTYYNYNPDTNSFYTDTDEYDPHLVHGVEVVGWDDNYSKSNFNEGSLLLTAQYGQIFQVVRQTLWLLMILCT